MEVPDAYSALLALGMPPCLPKPRDAKVDAPSGWHWSALSDLPPADAERKLGVFALRWFRELYGTTEYVRRPDSVLLYFTPTERMKMKRRRPRLGELLVGAELISEDQLELALSAQRKTGKRFGELLLDAGVISPDQLLAALALQLSVDWVPTARLDELRRSPAEVALNERTCRKFSVIGVDVDEELQIIWVAMHDPKDIVALDALKSATGKSIWPCLANADAIYRAIARCFPGDPAADTVKLVLPPLAVRAPSLLDALLQAARVLHGDPGGGTGMHAYALA